MRITPNSSVTCVLGGVLALAACCSDAGAAPLPLATFIISPDGTGGPTTPKSQTVTFCNSFDIGGCETSSASAGGFTASVTGNTQGGSLTQAASATAEITYYYQITGTANVLVPLHITGAVSTFVSGAGSNTRAQASILSGGTFGNVVACAETVTGNAARCGGLPTSATLNADYSLLTNTPDQIQLKASGLSNLSAFGTSGIGAGSFFAQADPLITIDPLFLASHPGFSLQLSSNISAIPVPGGLPLMISALSCLVGLAGHKRRIQSAV
jgi:hypothetical protein